MTLYITAAAFFLVGVATGYTFASIFERHEQHLSLTRNTLEKLLIESNIADIALQNKNEKEDLEG